MKDTVKNWLTEQFGADDALHAELYGEYAAEMKNSAAKLEGLAAAGDCAALGALGHAMKGMALQMGDQETAEACLRLQNAGRAADLPACVAAIREVTAFCAAL